MIFSLSGKHIQIIWTSLLPIVDSDHLSTFCQMLALLVMICNTQSFSWPSRKLSIVYELTSINLRDNLSLFFVSFYLSTHLTGKINQPIVMKFWLSLFSCSAPGKRNFKFKKRSLLVSNIPFWWSFLKLSSLAQCMHQHDVGISQWNLKKLIHLPRTIQAINFNRPVATLLLNQQANTELSHDIKSTDSYPQTTGFLASFFGRTD